MLKSFFDCVKCQLIVLVFNFEKEYVDFTSPKVRENVHTFKEGDLVVFGTPVYAGRVPNLMLNFIRTVQGCGAMAIPIVLFGNRLEFFQNILGVVFSYL